MINLFKTKLFQCFLFLIFSISLFAENGSISGKLVDEENGEILFGARVIIEGTSLGGVADIDGNFFIAKVPAGTYKLNITCLGYQNKVIDEIIVKPQLVTTLNTTLSTKVKVATEVTIVGQARKESVSAILVQQKNAEAASNGISAESIKQSPDRNTGEVLKRISGASIQDNKFAIIRGLSDRYNIATINGVLLPSSEPDRRAFSFDLIPASALENIIITKTATPDMPGDFSGGIIQLTTKDIPDVNAITVNVGTGFNSISSFKSYYSGNYSNKETFGFTDNKRYLPSNFPTTNLGSGSSDAGINAGKLLANNYAVEKHSNALPFTNLNLVGTTRTKFGEVELGTLTSLLYSNQRRTYHQTRMFYQTLRLEDTNLASLDTINTRQISIGGVFNVGLKLKQYNKFFFKNTFNQTTEDQFTDRSTIDVGSQSLTKSKIYQYTKNRIFLSQIGGAHLFAEQLKLEYVLGYGNLVRNIPDYKLLDYSKALGTGDPFTFVSDPNSTRRFFSDLSDNNYNASIKFTESLKLGNVQSKFKLGYYYAYKTRKFTPRALATQDYNSSNNNVDTRSDYKDILSPDNYRKTGFNLIEQTTNSDKYNAISAFHAVYAMADNNIKDKIRLIYGVRYEKQIQSIYSVPIGGLIEQRNRLNFPSFLPSINAVYSLNDKKNLRFAYFESVSRPEFRELASFSFYDYQLNGLTTGSPDLKQAKIHNFDFRYEVYKRANETFSISGFYKAFNNPIEVTINPAGGASNFDFEYVNLASPTAKGKDVYESKFRKSVYDIFWKGHSAINTGIELEYRTALSHDTSKFLKDFTFFGNLSLIYSQINTGAVQSSAVNAVNPRALQGQSPYVFNAGLQYSSPKNGWTVTALVNRNGKRIYSVDILYNLIENPRTIVDLAVSKKMIKDKFNIKLTFSDLLNQPFIIYKDTHKNDASHLSDIGKLFTSFNETSRRIENRYEPGKDQIYIYRIIGWGGALSLAYTF